MYIKLWDLVAYTDAKLFTHLHHSFKEFECIRTVLPLCELHVYLDIGGTYRYDSRVKWQRLTSN